MHLSKEVADPIRVYLVGVRNQLGDMPPQQAQKMLNDLQATILKALARTAAGRAPTVQDVRAVLAALNPSPPAARPTPIAPPPAFARQTPLVPPPAFVRTGPAVPPPLPPQAGMPAAARAYPPPPPPPSPRIAPLPDSSGAPLRDYQPSDGGKIKARVKPATPGGPKGGFTCLIRPDGLLLQKKNKPDISLPVGAQVTYLSASRFMAQTKDGELTLNVFAFGKYQNRLTRDLVDFLQGKRAMPVAGDYALPTALLVTTVVPFGIIAIAIGGLPLAVAGGVSCGCFAVAQLEKMAMHVRLAINSAMIVAGYAFVICSVHWISVEGWFSSPPAPVNVSTDSRQPAPPAPTPTPTPTPTPAPVRTPAPTGPPRMPSPAQNTPPPPPPKLDIASLGDAVAALGGADAGRQVDGALWLTKNPMKDPADILKAKNALTPLLTADDPRYRAAFARAFCVYAAKEDVPDLVKLATSDRKYGASQALAVTALVKLDLTAAQGVFEQRFDDGGYRFMAAGILAKELTSHDEEALWPMLASSKPQVQQEICGVLGKIGTAKSIPEIEKAQSKITDRRDLAGFKSRADRAIADIRKR